MFSPALPGAGFRTTAYRDAFLRGGGFLGLFGLALLARGPANFPCWLVLYSLLHSRGLTGVVGRRWGGVIGGDTWRALGFCAFCGGSGEWRGLVGLGWWGEVIVGLPSRLPFAVGRVSPGSGGCRFFFLGEVGGGGFVVASVGGEWLLCGCAWQLW